VATCGGDGWTDELQARVAPVVLVPTICCDRKRGKQYEEMRNRVGKIYDKKTVAFADGIDGKGKKSDGGVADSSEESVESGDVSSVGVWGGGMRRGKWGREGRHFEVI
jgi:hypothetical protein